MSVFLEILRCILCCDEREEDESRGSRERNRNSFNRSEVVPNYDTFSRSFAPTSTTNTRSISQSVAQTTAQIHSHNYSTSRKWPPVQTQDIGSKNSIPTKLPETLTVSFVKPKAAYIDSGIQHKSSSVIINPEPTKRTPEKSHEVSQKPKILPPSPYLATNKTTDQRLPHTLSSFSSQPSPSLSKLIASSSKPSQSYSTPPLPSLKPVSSAASSSFGTTSSAKPLQLSTKPTLSLAPFNPTNPKAKTNYIWSQKGTSPLQSLKPVSSAASSSFGTTSSAKPLQLSTKPTLSLAPFNPTNPEAKTNYIWSQKGTSPIYAIPEDMKSLIKKDVVPGVLKKPLSPLTYKDYFDALLYAEDFYIEKWDGFEMKNVTLELHEAAIYGRKGKYNYWNTNDEKDDKVFVTFQMDSIPERRPFLLSRDFVSVRPSGTKAEPFQGLIYRVVRSNRVLVEFGEDFHSCHYSACKYDVKFSFNRVCLKRAHQAIAAASDPLFRNFLFPECVPQNSIVAARFQSINPNLDREQVSAVRQILSHQNPPPYLMEGQISVEKSKQQSKSKQLSRTGLVVSEAVLQIYRMYPSCRILICTPTNSTCDVITRSLKKEIPEFDIFRANAAFRELDGVPFDILPNCLYKRECFSCPSLQELRNFKVILSTFMSSFRLHNEGIMAGHFSHIFLVDASSATEPETMVALANLANERTAVTITGAPGNHSGWVRSNIARQNGLMTSYFERLQESKLYESLDSKVITQLKDLGQKSDDTYSFLSFR